MIHAGDIIVTKNCVLVLQKHNMKTSLGVFFELSYLTESCMNSKVNSAFQVVAFVSSPESRKEMLTQSTGEIKQASSGKPMHALHTGVAHISQCLCQCLWVRIHKQTAEYKLT